MPFIPGKLLTDYGNEAAVTEFETAAGPTEYARGITKEALGVVEAKKVTLGPQGVLTQAERYPQGRFDFRLDGATQSYHRDAIYTRGRPFTDGEIRNQCDGGLDRFWGIQYKPSASGSWTSWTSTHWNCDTQTDYGFRLVSNSEFRIYDAPDEFASYCDPFA